MDLKNSSSGLCNICHYANEEGITPDVCIKGYKGVFDKIFCVYTDPKLDGFPTAEEKCLRKLMSIKNLLENKGLISAINQPLNFSSPLKILYCDSQKEMEITGD